MKTLDIETLFIPMIHKGIFEVRKDDSIWRMKKRCKTQTYPINPYRADKTTSNKGYRHVRIRVNGIFYKILAHRIIWIYHNGNIPEGYEINHRDGLKENNILSNLEIVTRSENSLHNAHVLGNCIGEKHGMAKLSKEKIVQIKRLRKAGKTYVEIGNIYHVTPPCIRHIFRGRTWAHIL